MVLIVEKAIAPYSIIILRLTFLIHVPIEIGLKFNSLLLLKIQGRFLIEIA